MLVFENIKLAFRSLQANKMRALLTMLGIIIGIGSVIAIMTVSSSLTTSISDSFQEMGANNISVGLKEKSDTATTKNGLHFGSMNRAASMESEDYITDEMIDTLTSAYSDSIDAIAISETVGDGTIKSGSDSANISISGINKDYFKSKKITLLAGRHIKSSDISKGKRSSWYRIRW